MIRSAAMILSTRLVSSRLRVSRDVAFMRSVCAVPAARTLLRVSLRRLSGVMKSGISVTVTRAVDNGSASCDRVLGVCMREVGAGVVGRGRCFACQREIGMRRGSETQGSRARKRCDRLEMLSQRRNRAEENTPTAVYRQGGGEGRGGRERR